MTAAPMTAVPMTAVPMTAVPMTAASDPEQANDAPRGPGHGTVRRVVIAGGTGLIGRALASSLIRDGVEVDILSRDPARRRDRLAAGARPVRWAPADAGAMDGLARTLAGADAVVSVTGVPVGPLPWTPWRKRAILASRAGTAALIVEAMGRLTPEERPRTFVSAAGTDGYTGLDAQPARETTDTSLTPGFLAEVGRAWEAAAAPAAGLGVRTVIVRTSFVLARDSSLLRLMALPVRLFIGGRYGSGEQWFSWIHLDDLVAVYRRAIDDPSLAGPVNATSPTAIRQHEVATTLGRVLGRPIWFTTPTWLLRILLRGQATLLLGSRRVAPTRLLAADFSFRFPDLETALRDALGRPPLPS